MLNKIIKFFFIFFIYLIIFSPKEASANILYESNSSIITSYVEGVVFFKRDSFEDNFFTSGVANIFAGKLISDNLYAKFYIAANYLSSRKNDASYNALDALYVGVDSEYGNFYIGNTPTVYYNGFPSGWLDYKVINSHQDATDPDYYGNFFTTKSASKSIFYSYKFSNFKFALQGSAKDSDLVELDNKEVNLDRDYGLGIGLGYAYGPIQIGGSYINAKFTDKSQLNDDFILSVASIGAKIDIFGWYSAVGIFYDKNRWDIGNEAYSFQYLIKYNGYQIFNKRIVPQIVYSYKYYTIISNENIANAIPNNDVYASLTYFLNNYFEVFVEGKLDMRNSSQIHQLNNDKYLRHNRIGIGVKANF